MADLFAIGIVGHIDRHQMLNDLTEEVRPTCIAIDDGNVGPGLNHKRVWAEMATYDNKWSVVLEDDALPITGFREQLAEALESAPTPIVSLYLGKLRPPMVQPQIEDAIDRADAEGASWIIADELFHAVGVAVHTELIDDMLTGLKPYLPIDQAIGRWARTRGHEIAYSWPSLVQHLDSPTLIKHQDNVPRVPGRVAHRVGSRAFWMSKSVRL